MKQTLCHLYPPATFSSAAYTDRPHLGHLGESATLNGILEKTFVYWRRKFSSCKDYAKIVQVCCSSSLSLSLSLSHLSVRKPPPPPPPPSSSYLNFAQYCSRQRRRLRESSGLSTAAPPPPAQLYFYPRTLTRTPFFFFFSSSSSFFHLPSPLKVAPA